MLLYKPIRVKVDVDTIDRFLVRLLQQHRPCGLLRGHLHHYLRPAGRKGDEGGAVRRRCREEYPRRRSYKPSIAIAKCKTGTLPSSYCRSSALSESLDNNNNNQNCMDICLVATTAVSKDISISILVSIIQKLMRLPRLTTATAYHLEGLCHRLPDTIGCGLSLLPLYYCWNQSFSIITRP